MHTENNAAPRDRAGSTDRSGTTTGAWAEQLAERWLRSEGLTLHTRNFTRRVGEIDLVLREESTGTWVFVEVKYRGLNALCTGVDAVTAKKQRTLYRTAQLFLQRLGDQTSAARIDVVVITKRASDRTSHEKTLSQDTQLPPGHVRLSLKRLDLLWIQNAVSA